jgi:hypothetical protein
VADFGQLEMTACGKVWSLRLLRVQEIVSSNLTTPTEWLCEERIAVEHVLVRADGC